MTANKNTVKPAGGNSAVQIALTVLLAGAAFAIGSMWTELRLIKAGKGAAADQVAQEEAPAEPQEEQPLSDEQWQAVLTDPVYAEGPEDAQVTLVEFTDYQCPFCKRHFDQTEAQLQSEYIKTGKMRWVIRDLPLSFHQNAHLAAEAARCAGDQNKYKQMHDKLFETQTVWAESATAQTIIAGYAKVLGMDGTIFTQCLSSGKHKAAVDADLALAGRMGANGTPTFFVNGQPLIGAQPFSAFKAVIDAALE
jgi:protein-disulfide isomerase